jgi:multiple sugar transport system permease protein
MIQKISDFVNDHLIVIVIGITFFVLLLVVLVPIIYVFLMSFFYIHISGSMKFVGLGNYLRALNDPIFWQYIYQSLIYTMGSVLISLLISFPLSVSLNEIRLGKSFFRSLVLLPWVIPSSISGVIWRWMLNDTNGLINYFLHRIGIIDTSILFLGTTFWARMCVILADSWIRIPFMTILLLAGLQSIPLELYEAAKVDGANYFEQLFKITIPLMKSTILIVLMIVTMFVIRTYEIIYILTDGGPATRTEVITTYIYKTTVQYWELGYGSALSVFLLIVVVFITLFFTQKLAKRSNE